MTESLSPQEKAREFVRKLNNDEYDFAKAENADQQKTLDSLANAANAFEVAERDFKSVDLTLEKVLLQGGYRGDARKYNYDMAVSNLNRFIKVAKINKLYSERSQKVTKEELENMKNLNTKLVTQKTQLQTVIDKIFNEYPKIKEKYETFLTSVKIEEGKIE
jgi:hypothetical protein